MCTNNMQAGPNINEERSRAGAIRATSSSSPIRIRQSCAGRRLDPADRNVGRKRGCFGNAERRTQFWRQQVQAPGEGNRISGS